MMREYQVRICERLGVKFPEPTRQIEERPDAAERLDAAASGEVGAIDAVAVAEEHAQAECLAFVGGDAEVLVEVAAGRGEPGDGPAHALPVALDLGERGYRYKRKGRVARV